MSCGSDNYTKKLATHWRGLGAGKHWSWPSRFSSKVWSIIYAARRRQVLIEIEKVRQRGLLSDRDVHFLASLGLTQERNPVDQKKGEPAGK